MIHGVMIYYNDVMSVNFKAQLKIKFPLETSLVQCGMHKLSSRNKAHTTPMIGHATPWGQTVACNYSQPLSPMEFGLIRYGSNTAVDKLKLYLESQYRSIVS